MTEVLFLDLELVAFLLKPSEGLVFVSRPGKPTRCSCGDGGCA